MHSLSLLSGGICQNLSIIRSLASAMKNKAAKDRQGDSRFSPSQPSYSPLFRLSDILSAGGLVVSRFIRDYVVSIS